MPTADSLTADALNDQAVATASTEASASVPAFVGMQLAGLCVGVAVILALYPDAGEKADDVVIPHTH